MEKKEHLLHVYTSQVDKYTLLKRTLTSPDGPNALIVITSDDQHILSKELDQYNIELRFLKPNDLTHLGNKIKGDKHTKLVVDADSFSDNNQFDIVIREQRIKAFLSKYNLSCLCLYKVHSLSPELLKHLISIHSGYQLTTSDITLVSGDFIRDQIIPSRFIQKSVKDNLEAIILALLNRGAICGSDIISIIHTEFKVLLSPGTIYPLLHSLEEKGFVTWIKEGKEKKYVHVEGSELRIKRLIDEYIFAQKILNSYLNKEMDLKNETEFTQR